MNSQEIPFFAPHALRNTGKVRKQRDAAKPTSQGLKAAKLTMGGASGKMGAQLRNRRLQVRILPGVLGHPMPRDDIRCLNSPSIKALRVRTIGPLPPASLPSADNPGHPATGVPATGAATGSSARFPGSDVRSTEGAIGRLAIAPASTSRSQVGVAIGREPRVAVPGQLLRHGQRHAGPAQVADERVPVGVEIGEQAVLVPVRDPRPLQVQLHHLRGLAEVPLGRPQLEQRPRPGRVRSLVSSHARSRSTTVGWSGITSALRRLLCWAGRRTVGGADSRSNERRVSAASSPRRNPVQVARM